MFANSKLLIAAAGIALFLTSQGAVEAGYVSTSLQDLEASAIVETDLGSSEGCEALPSNPSELPQSIDVVQDVLNPTGQVSPIGGMSAPAGENAGAVNVFASAAVPAVASVQLPMTSWVGVEGRKWLPPPFSTGIFRPPRVEQC